MAKSAKQVDSGGQLDKQAAKYIPEILRFYANIETARGKFLNAAQQERARMTDVYEALASFGVSQRASRTHVKIVRLLAQIDKCREVLAEEDRKMLARLMKAQGDKRQLSLFDLPESKPKKKPARFVDELRKATDLSHPPGSNGELKP